MIVDLKLKVATRSDLVESFQHNGKDVLRYNLSVFTLDPKLKVFYGPTLLSNVINKERFQKYFNSKLIYVSESYDRDIPPIWEDVEADNQLTNNNKLQKIKIGITSKQCVIGLKVNYYSWYDSNTGEHSEPRQTEIISEVYNNGILVCKVKGISGVVALTHLETIK